MLARKKAAKKKAIASHSSALSSVAPRGKSGAATSRTRKAADVVAHGGRPLTRADAQDVSTEAEKADLIKAIGDDVNTRLIALHQRGGGGGDGDSDIDDDTNFHEKQAQLMEEARLAAGLQQRNVSKHMDAYFEGTNAGLPTVRVHHNVHTITAVAALGLEVLVLGDKSGRVFMVDLAATPDTPSLFAPAASGDGKSGKGKDSDSQQQKQQQGKNVNLAAYHRRRKMALEPTLPRAVVSIAVSDTRSSRPTTRDLFEKTTVDLSCPSYTAAGAEDGSIAIWETFTQKHKGLLFMHRKAVTGLSFRIGTADLYSASEDGTLRVWSVPQMMSLDKLFGHEGKVHGLHCLKRETCATVGDDGTLRFWKVDAATQQAYTYTVGQREESLAAGAASGELLVLPEHSTTAPADSTPSAAVAAAAGVAVHLECVAMVSESIVLAGAVDGSLVLFDVGKRRPLVVVLSAHGYDSLQDGTGLEQSAQRWSSMLDESEEEGKKGAHDAVHSLLGPNSTSTAATAARSGGVTLAGGSSGGRTRPPRAYDRRRIPNAISAVATVPYANVAASASYDGTVRLWQVSGVGADSPAAGRPTAVGGAGTSAANSSYRAGSNAAAANSTPALTLLAELPVHALVTSLRFSPDGDCLYIACAKECRRGRWIVCRAAQNGVAVVPLTAGGARQLLGTSGTGKAIPAAVLSIEHVPAQLYHFDEKVDADHEKEAAKDSAESGSAADVTTHHSITRASRKPAPGNDLELEYLDSEGGEDEEGNGAMDSDAGVDGKSADSSRGAYFAVGKDGQLMFTPGGGSGSATVNDVMKAHALHSTVKGLRRAAKAGKTAKRAAVVAARATHSSSEKRKAGKNTTDGSLKKMKLLKKKAKKET